MAPCLEVAVFSGPAGLQAQQMGAHRIELNALGSYDAGGLTPPLGELLSIIPRLTIPVRIMIRPRGPPPDGEDFFYTDDEIQRMLRDIRDFKASGAMDPQRGDGFVFGALKRGVSGSPGSPGPSQSSPRPSAMPGSEVLVPDKRQQQQQQQQQPFANDEANGGRGTRRGSVAVDEETCRRLVDAAQPFPCVFHRAFDAILTEHPSEDRRAAGLASVVRCSFSGILTAGGPGDCTDNIDTLTRLLETAGGKNLQIIAGGGLRSHNACTLVDRLVDRMGPDGIWLHTASWRPRNDESSLAGELDPSQLSKLLAVIASS